MPITVSPMTDGFAAEVGDIDLSRELDAQTEREVREAFTQYAVLIFTGQVLTERPRRNGQRHPVERQHRAPQARHALEADRLSRRAGRRVPSGRQARPTGRSRSHRGSTAGP